MVKVTPEIRAKILKLRAVGYNNQEIAEKLDLHPSTVSYQIQLMKAEAEKKGGEDAFLKFLLGAAVGAGAVGLGVLLAKLLEEKK